MAVEGETRAGGGDAGMSLGPSRELLSVLGYIFNVVGALLLLVAEDDEFVRHHAAQSLLFTAVVVAARIVASVVGGILGFVPLVGGLLATLISAAVWIGAVGGFLFLAYRAYSGERYRLPVLGEYIDDVEDVF